MSDATSLHHPYNITVRHALNPNTGGRWYRAVISRDGLLLVDFFNIKHSEVVRTAVSYFHKNKHSLAVAYQKMSKNNKK